MAEKSDFKLTKGHLIARNENFTECVQSILEKPPFADAKRVLAIEDITNHRVYIYPVPPKKSAIIVHLETGTKEEMNETLSVLLVQLKRLDFVAIFDSGLCPKKELCRWKGFFWGSPTELPALNEFAATLDHIIMEIEMLG